MKSILMKNERLVYILGSFLLVSTLAMLAPTKLSAQTLLTQEYKEPEKLEFKNKVSGAALVRALRQGGHIIYFRHVSTEIDYADQIVAKMGYCHSQRMLSEKGWQQARKIGLSFQSLQIPVDKVYSSEYCRAWQTADLAFGRYQKDSRLNFLPKAEYDEMDTLQMKKAVFPLLATIPAQGKNNVIVGHDDIFEAATGIYPEPQGVAFVLTPNGRDGFEIIAKVLPDEWNQLLP
ncbi:Phosphoglycerate mutase [Tumidithrix helvetica PCC 7403]|uniref:histidine phosphatase family protein n=1 Tax=Tumidithrix helvetica TaxID=3457545 RepID=UPI003CBAA221